MGRFASSVVFCLGFLVCLVHYVCPFVVTPGVQVYRSQSRPAVRYGLSQGQSFSFPVSGKTYVATGSNIATPGIAMSRNIISAPTLTQAGRRQSGFLTTVSSGRSQLANRGYMVGGSLTAIPSMTAFTAMQPSFRQLTTSMSQRPAGRIYTVAPYTVRSMAPSVISGGYLAQLTRNPTPITSPMIGQSRQMIGRAGTAISRGSVSRGSALRGMTKTGTSIKKPYKPTVVVPPRPPVKKYKKTIIKKTKPYRKSSKKYSKKSSKKTYTKKSRSKKDKARRKAELRAKLAALKAKRLKKKKYAA